MPEALSARSLRLRLERLLQSEDIRACVKALGTRMQAEPGVHRSADLVEAILVTGK